MTIKPSAQSGRKKSRPPSSKGLSEIFFTAENIVSCDGNGINFGHPKIYLKTLDTHPVECPYCSKQFQKTTSIIN